MKKKYLLNVLLPIAVGLTAWLLPTEAFGIPNLTIVEHRLIAIFLFSALMWVTEGIPIWATSVVTIVVMLLSISDSSAWFLVKGISPAELGTLVKYKTIMATFADPIIMLFIGGFFLAMGATKTGLDLNLARVLLKPFGTKSENVLLGVIVITALFSMFMSNTATAAMMLAILAPVLKCLPSDGKGKIALALAIPIAANIGGIGTPIGTPPNAIALKFLNDPEGLNLNIGFGQWMGIMVPYITVLLFIAWFLLRKMFPFKQKRIKLDISGSFEKGIRAYIVYATFAGTVLLWMLDKPTGINSNVVAMIPVAVFCVTGVVSRNDLSNISWDVLWLVAGGFALGVGLQDTGLARDMIAAIPFATWPAPLVIVGAGVVCCVMSTFMSNTATSALLIPVLAAVGEGMNGTLTPYGGIVSLLVGIALSASLAMALPISTPPNALAHATGLTKQKDMARIGIALGVIGIILAYAMLIFSGKYLF